MYACVCMYVSVCACECVRESSGVLRWISAGLPEMSYPDSPQSGEQVPCSVQASWGGFYASCNVKRLSGRGTGAPLGREVRGRPSPGSGLAGEGAGATLRWECVCFQPSASPRVAPRANKNVSPGLWLPSARSGVGGRPRGSAPPGNDSPASPKGARR